MEIDSQLDVVTVPRGIKRPGEDGLENDQRLSKRFSLLSLRGLVNSTPVSQHPVSQTVMYDTTPMQVDETKDRVYVYNLDEELSEMEPSDEKLVFLPEIEKRLTKIPKSVLTSHNPPPPVTNQELVLYSVPSSLSVPEEQDSVRKVIIEARARARDRQVERDQPLELSADTNRNGWLAKDPEHEEAAMVSPDDVDAMDLG